MIQSHHNKTVLACALILSVIVTNPAHANKAAGQRPVNPINYMPQGTSILLHLETLGILKSKVFKEFSTVVPEIQKEVLSKFQVENLEELAKVLDAAIKKNRVDNVVPPVKREVVPVNTQKQNNGKTTPSQESMDLDTVNTN